MFRMKEICDMIVFLMAALGGLVNRIRGGLIENFPNRRTMTAIVFGIAVASVTQTWWGLLGGLGMLAGQSLGWGRYIGALGGWEKKKLKEVAFIDFLIDFLSPLSVPILGSDDVHKGNGTYKHSPIKCLRRWGFAGLSLRGFVWSLAIWVSLLPVMTLNGFWGALVGLLMPVCYLLPQGILKNIGCNDRLMWEWGEVLFGFILWGTVFLCLAI